MQQSAQPLPVNNRWLEIWIKPRAVIRDVINTDPTYRTIFIMLIAGIVLGLRHGLAGVLLAPLVIFPVLYLYAFLLWWVGSWFGGKGTNKRLRIASVWGYYLPAVQWRVAFIVLSLLSGFLPFDFVRYILLFLAVVAIFWTLAIHCQAVAEAHEFTAIKALFALLIVFTMFITPFIAAFFFLS